MDSNTTHQPARVHAKRLLEPAIVARLQDSLLTRCSKPISTKLGRRLPLVSVEIIVVATPHATNHHFTPNINRVSTFLPLYRPSLTFDRALTSHR